MMLLFLILAIVFLCLYLDQRNINTILMGRIDRLNRRIEELTNTESKEEFIEGEIHSPIENKIDSVVLEAQEEKIPTIEKHIDEKRVREHKITWILSTGVILVFLAAIVFMISTWTTIPDIVKTIILLATAGVFYIAGGISKKLLNLEKTSFAFTVLANLYLPISLISIAFFKLIRPYFSVGGEGQTLYFALVSLISALAYLYTLNLYDNKFLTWLFMLADLSVVISVVSFFTDNINVIYLVLILYNLTSMFIFNNVKIESKLLEKIKKEELNFMNIIMFILIFLSVFNFSGNTIFYGMNIIIASFMFLLSALYKENKNYDYLFCIFLAFGLFKWFGDIIAGNLRFISFAFIAPIFVILSKLFLEDKKRVEGYNIFAYLGATISFIITSFYFAFNVESVDIYTIIACLLIFLTYLYLALRDGSIFCAIAMNLSLIVTGYIMCRLPIFDFNSIITSNYLTSLITILFLSLFMFNKSKKLSVLKTGTAFVTAFFMPYMYMFQKIFMWGNPVPSYIFIMLSILILYGIYINLNKENDSKAFLKVIIPAIVGVALIDVVASLGSLSMVNFAFIGIFLFTLSLTNYIRKNCISESYFVTSHIWLAVANIMIIFTYLESLIYHSYNTLNSVATALGIVYAVALLIVSSYSILKVKGKTIRTIMKVMEFVAFNLLIASIICITKNYEIAKYTLAISTGIVLVTIIGAKLFNSKFLINYIAITIGLNFLILGFGAGISEYFVLLGMAYLMMICCYKNKSNTNYDCVPLIIITFLNIFVASTVFKENSIAVLITIINILIMIAVQIPLYKKEIRKASSIATIIPVISILFLPIENGEKLLAVDFIKPATFFLWNLIGMNYSENKKGYKTIFALALLWPYYLILDAIKCSEILLPVLTYMPTLLVIIALTRKIFDYSKGIRIIEYIAQFLIYGIIIILSADTFEKGIVFGVALFIMILLSSNMNYGTILVGTTIALLVAVFLQTLDFWVNVPWWLYLLIIGAGMIIFAMRNEIVKNQGENNKNNMGDWLEKIKEKMKD